jgi:hypothetical protein
MDRSFIIPGNSPVDERETPHDEEKGGWAEPRQETKVIVVIALLVVNQLPILMLLLLLLLLLLNQSKDIKKN